jgi:WXXGXW repeat (2 copies)
VLVCLPAMLGLSACAIHEDTEPPAQSAPLAVAPAPAPAPVAPAAIVAAPAVAPARQQAGETYRPTVEAPTAPTRFQASNGTASAPAATHVAVAPAAGAATAPPAGGYADDPSIVVNGAPPPPRPELASPTPGAGYAWVSGHWAWRGSWVWAPGSWKPIPAGRRQWVAGAWIAQGTQSRWQPGYWA